MCCSYINTAVEVDPDKPVLVDKYLDRAIELDVDALRDKEGNIVICGIMEHIEQVRGELALTPKTKLIPMQDTFGSCLWNLITSSGGVVRALPG